MLILFTRPADHRNLRWLWPADLTSRMRSATIHSNLFSQCLYSCIFRRQRVSVSRVAFSLCFILIRLISAQLVLCPKAFQSDWKPKVRNYHISWFRLRNTNDFHHNTRPCLFCLTPRFLPGTTTDQPTWFLRIRFCIALKWSPDVAFVCRCDI